MARPTIGLLEHSCLFFGLLLLGCGGRVEADHATSLQVAGASASGASHSVGGALASSGTTAMPSTGGSVTVVASGGSKSTGSFGTGGSLNSGGGMGNANAGATARFGAGGRQTAIHLPAALAGATTSEGIPVTGGMGLGGQRGGAPSDLGGAGGVRASAICEPPDDTYYVVGTNFEGTAFAFVSLTEDGTNVAACRVAAYEDRLCLKAQIPLVGSGMNTDNWPRVAVIGVNLNQDATPSAPANAVSRRIKTATATYTTRLGADVRYQVNVAGQYYSAFVLTNVTDPGTYTKSVSTFYEECWLPNSPAWNGTGAIGFQLNVVRYYTDAYSVDICLRALEFEFSD